MPVPWIDQTDLTNAFADVLKKAASGGSDPLATYWQSILTRANLSATADLTRIYLGLGFTIEQVDSDDFIVTTATNLAIWYAINTGGIAADFTPEFLKSLDIREDLAEGALVFNAGVPQVPLTGPVGGIDSSSIAGATEATMYGRRWFL
jgi:hypothetical protein